ncbi:MAG: zincin-like metallopeptidase domain-containing protein [Erythrobacter sp.]
MNRKPRPDVAQVITDLILEKIAAGTAPWLKPWSATSTRPLRHNGVPYTGINTFFLWAVAEACGYASPYWMTYRQAAELGGQVRKGESGSYSVFYSTAHKTDTDRQTGKTTEKTIRFMKWNHVFNASQIDGLPAHYYPEPPDPRAIGELSAGVRDFLDAIPIRVVHGGSSAHYTPATDTVTLPQPQAFHSIEAYFSVRAHESIHATGSSNRLNRQFGKRFGDQAYSLEEMVASFGQALLCAEYGLPPELHDSHASYLAHWISVMKADKTAILHAAAKAEQAVQWLRQFDPALAEPERRAA